MPKPRRQHLGDLGLAHARLAFQEQRPAELEGQEYGGREPPLRHVVLRGEELLGGIDAGRQGFGIHDTFLENAAAPE